jgi:hypothetical protein
MTDVALYAVGGSVRDELLGLPTKDYDFTAVVQGEDTVEGAWCAPSGCIFSGMASRPSLRPRSSSRSVRGSLAGTSTRV